MGRVAAGVAVAVVAAMVAVVIAGGGPEDGAALASTVPSAMTETAPAAPPATVLPTLTPATTAGAPLPCEPVVEHPAAPAADPSALTLARQKAANRLAGGDAAQHTLALLLQAPPVDDATQRADWAAQVRASALASSDAPTLRAAASACPQVTDARGCRLQLIRRRIDLDPGNALPWVESLAEDPAAADAAWAGLAAASHWHDEPQHLATMLDQSLDPDLPAPLRTALLADAAARDVDRPTAALSTLQNHCGHWGSEHPLGHACAHGVALMLAEADSPRTVLEGAALARSMGWDKERVAAAEASARRLLAAAPVDVERGCRRP